MRLVWVHSAPAVWYSVLLFSIVPDIRLHCMLVFLSLPEKTKVQVQGVTVSHVVDLDALEK